MAAFLQTTCQDAARFGHLLLHNGNWDGTQIVPEAWVTEATQPSQELNRGYGYLWWLNTRRHLDAAVAEAIDADPDAAQAVPGAPEDMYWAIGAFGQVVQIDPGSDTVVVRFGAGANIYDYATLVLTARVVTDALTP
jgi:CubicO group peptidase (beta-lactamase class C family)